MVTNGCLKQILSWSHSQILAIKGFTAKKSLVLNDDEPRPVPIPKNSAHLMIQKLMRLTLTSSESSESSESIQSRSDANAHIEVSEYTLKSKFPEIYQTFK